MISLRRLRWSACCLLLVCLLWLSPGTRQHIHRYLLSSWLGPDVSVGQLIIHHRHSLLEASQLQWTGGRGARRFQLTAEQGWLAVEGGELLRGQASFPQLVLRSADVRLEHDQESSTDAVFAWKRLLAQHLAPLDWGQLQGTLASLGAAQKLTRSLGERVERWLARSREIVAEVEQLEQQVAGMDNPLRFEESVQEKLARIRELSVEQNLLANQFEALPQHVAEGKADLQKLLEQDRTRLVGLVIGSGETGLGLNRGLTLSGEGQPSFQTDPSQSQLQRERLCLELADELALGFSQQLLPYGEIVELMAATSRPQPRASYDLDFRPGPADSECLAVPRWKAAGNFYCGELSVPYQATGDWVRVSAPKGAEAVRSAWEVDFHPDGRHHTVHVKYATNESPATRVWLIDKASAGTATESRRDLSQLEQDPSCSSLSLTVADGLVRGRLTLRVHSLVWLTGQDHWSHNPTEAAIEAPLLFDVTGDWQAVTVRPTGMLPAWFVQAVRADLEQRLHLVLKANAEQLQRSFEHQLHQLQATLAGAVEQLQPLAREHTRQLMATRDRLQQFMDVSGTQFARQPGELIR